MASTTTDISIARSFLAIAHTIWERHSDKIIALKDMADIDKSKYSDLLHDLAIA